jgi:rhamnogalacturonyl hydrolase YesR
VKTNDPSSQDYHWKWIDAFFMAAPVFSQLGNLFGDTGYFDKMTALYTDTDAVHSGLPQTLYSAADDLWHRDKNFLPSQKLTKNDKKIFWSRGNGWVFAGLARVLEHLPLDYIDRDLYINRFRDMAASLRACQRPDGFWNVNLGDPDDFAGRETSGTALFTYALAWGINNEILTANDYRDVVRRAWEAMVRDAVQEKGKLGYIQRAANEPCDWMHSDQVGRSPFQEECTWQEREEAYVSQLTDAYGVGAFLLAGSEVAKLASQSIHQAEEADRIGGGARVESNHDGYHGSGFVNFPLHDGFIVWTAVDGGLGGPATLSFRHALRPNGSRKVRLIVNGVKQDITFVSTGAWNNWQQLAVVVLLNPGPHNTIRLRTTGKDSANIDALLVQTHTP